MYGAAYPVRGVVALGPVFGPEVYGVTDGSSPDQPTMSAMARQDRQRGIIVDPDEVSGPVLVVAGGRAGPDDAPRLLPPGGRSVPGALARHLPDVLAWVDAL